SARSLISTWSFSSSSSIRARTACSFSWLVIGNHWAGKAPCRSPLLSRRIFLVYRPYRQHTLDLRDLFHGMRRNLALHIDQRIRQLTPRFVDHVHDVQSRL